MENVIAIICTVGLIVCILYVTGNLGIKPKGMKQAEPAQQQQQPILSMIEVFVSSECSHCVAFKPELDILAQKCKEQNISYRLVVPSDPDVEIMMKTRNIQYFPCTLIKGQAYQGERTADAILKALSETK